MNTQKAAKKISILDAISLPTTHSYEGSFRWQATVPLATNPFLVMDFTQLAFVGAAIALFVLLTGSWVMEGGLAAADIWASVFFTGWIFMAIICAFISLSVLCFRNRYFATFQIDSEGIYTEGCRGTDQRNNFLRLSMRPYPVSGPVVCANPKGRHLPWQKVTHFVDIPTMRVIHLKRGYWHMMRLYTPDTATHALAIACLTRHLAHANAPQESMGKRNV